MEDFLKNRKIKSENSRFRSEIYSKVFKAGHRTYFLDVKSTRNQEYYITITESKKIFEQDGKINYEKHKIFLYREDFEKFYYSLQDVMEYILDKQPYEENEKVELEPQYLTDIDKEVPDADFTNLSFEDLSR